VNRGALVLFAALSGCSSCSKEKKAGPADAAPKPTDTFAIVTPPPADSTPPLPPQDKVEGFEGEIKMKVETASLKQPAELQLLVRGDRVTYEAPNGLAGHDAMAIYDFAMRRMVIYSREDRLFVVVDNPSDAGAPADAGAMTLKPTGKKEKVDGMPCDVFEEKGEKKEKTTACIVDGVPFLDYGKLSNTIATPPAWMQALSGTKRFVARMVQTADDGAILTRFEVTKFSKHPIPPGLVTVPPGFTRQGGRPLGSPLKPGMPN
jgi:hypothetical protein